MPVIPLSLNAKSPMLRNDSGKDILVRALSPSNALTPILVRLLPSSKITELRFKLFLNALAPMLTRDFGSWISSI